MSAARERLAVALSPALLDALEELVAERVQAVLEQARADREWLTLDEAASRYRTTAAALRKRAQRGTLPGAVRDGSRWLVETTALDAALSGAQGQPDTSKGPRR